MKQEQHNVTTHEAGQSGKGRVDHSVLKYAGI